MDQISNSCTHEVKITFSVRCKRMYVFRHQRMVKNGIIIAVTHNILCKKWIEKTYFLLRLIVRAVVAVVDANTRFVF